MVPGNWNPARGHFYSKNTMHVFGVLLSLLLCLTTVWFYMACMVAVRVLRGLGAEDSRSDEEEDEESPLEDVPEVHTGQISESKETKVNGVNGDGGLKKRR
jgi:acyl-CoA-dependent ceramide synthase